MMDYLLFMAPRMIFAGVVIYLAWRLAWKH